MTAAITVALSISDISRDSIDASCVATQKFGRSPARPALATAEAAAAMQCAQQRTGVPSAIPAMITSAAGAAAA